MFFLNTRTLSRIPRPWNFCSFVRKVVQLNYSYKRLPFLNWNRLPNVWSKIREVTRVIRIHRLHFPWGAAFLRHPPLKLAQCFCARHWNAFKYTHTAHTHTHARTPEHSHFSRAVFSICLFSSSAVIWSAYCRLTQRPKGGVSEGCEKYASDYSASNPVTQKY